MKVNETVKLLESGGARTLMAQLYGEDGVEANVKRYEDLLAGYEKMFGGEGDVKLFSSPGRTEISGNHTDHNHGKVLAGSINLDCVGVAGTNESNQVHIVSETYNQDFTIDLNHLEPSEKKAGTVDLVKGLLKGFEESGYSVGGFNAYITSNVISAAGVSSSASFEMLLCSMLNTFFNEGRMDTVAYAHIGKYSENNYWDKASGLLDQMACAVGGLITIDFVEPSAPAVEKIDFDFGSQNHSLIIVQTGKGHADLSAEYSSVPIEMKKAAQVMGKEVLADVDEKEFMQNLNKVRKEAGDRAVMRALHFFAEQNRVDAAVKAIKEKDYDTFLQCITKSGNSSWKWLQNCFATKDETEQAVPVALALTEMFIEEAGRGYCRVHGGGFAGVIAAVLPKDMTADYVEYMTPYMGKENIYVMQIRQTGAVHMDF